jgi:hypothetical protein
MKELINLYLSPFVRPTIRLHIGRKRFGVPFYYPRKKVSLDYHWIFFKTKWSNTDYRFERPPFISLVFYNFQIYLWLTNENDHEYFQAWLYYTNDTDHDDTTENRLKDAINNFPLTYIVHGPGDTRRKVNYYEFILKNKWKYLIEQQ